MSSTYFEQHPQKLSQWGRTRRNGADTAPQVGLHTYEATWSAEQGAKYLTERTTYGSYHWLTGLDKNIHLAPWSSETWHAVNLNNWSVGVSVMWQAGKWGQLSAQNRATLINGMAMGAHLFSRWCVANGKGPVQARKLTREQALRRESGFIYHGDTQADRSDPGPDFPLNEFLAEFRRLEAGGKKPAAVKPAASKPASNTGSTKPWPAGRGPWPDAYLTVTGNRNQYQDRALFKLLGDAGYDGATLAIRLQKRLKADNEYHGAITAQSRIGPQTIQAWQRFLKKRRYYTGSVTPRSQWGPSTTRATVNFLNDQAKLYHR